MTHYLIHLFCPVAKGTEEKCKQMRDMLVKNGNEAKHLMVISIQEWDEIWANSRQDAEKFANGRQTEVLLQKQGEVPKCPRLFAKVSQFFFWLCSLFPSFLWLLL